MKTIILYYSNHHGNTKRLVKAVADAGVETIDVSKQPENRDLSEYDVIGIASGIYAGNFGKPILTYVEKNLPEQAKTFLIYTCAKPADRYTNSIKKILNEKNSDLLGEYRCQGYNTFGPFKLVGGTAKGHPTQDEIDAAVVFYHQITKAYREGTSRKKPYRKRQSGRMRR